MFINTDVGGLLRGFFLVGKITPGLKLVRVMLENSNLPRKYTHIFNFRKYTF